MFIVKNIGKVIINYGLIIYVIILLKKFFNNNLINEINIYLNNKKYIIYTLEDLNPYYY